jgi:periplasmic divalent cation tolerance protein
MKDVIVVFVTVNGEEEGRRIAGAIVEESLAACVNIVPSIRSIYKWEGSIEDEEESLLIIKTVKGRLEDLKKTIAEIHSYDTPEVIALPVEGGSDDYLNWVRNETGKSEKNR